MNIDLYTRAKKAKNPTEIMEIAKSVNFNITERQAEMYFRQLQENGELCDSELENVVGGVCVKVNGKQYTLVTNLCSCFTGRYKANYTKLRRNGEGSPWALSSIVYTNNDTRQRNTWALTVAAEAKVCGTCKYLEFKGDLGYCSLS